MTDDELFLDTLQDLSQKTWLGDRYGWVRASGIVRQLLIDGSSSLVHPINREHRLKLTFQVPEDPVLEKGTVLWLAGDMVAKGLQFPIRSVDLDGFLATRLMYAGGHWFTVREIVTTVANAFGGVHRGEPKDTVQQELNAVNAAFPHLLGGPVFLQMRGIGHITLIGLRSLAEAVAKKRGVPLTWTMPA